MSLRGTKRGRSSESPRPAKKLKFEHPPPKKITIAPTSPTAVSPAYGLGFSQELKVDCAKPFVAEDVTTPEQAKEGQKCILFKPTTPFPFKKLPVELRLEVYKGVLQHESPLPISMFARGPKSPKGGKAELCSRGVCSHFEGSFPNPANLLLADKQICAEATPILYGSNKFMFYNTAALKDFVRIIGDQKKWLTNLEVFHCGADGGKYSLATTLPMLVGCGRLKRLEIEDILQRPKLRTHIGVGGAVVKLMRDGDSFFRFLRAQGFSGRKIAETLVLHQWKGRVWERPPGGLRYEDRDMTSTEKDDFLGGLVSKLNALR